MTGEYLRGQVEKSSMHVISITAHKSCLNQAQ